MHARVMIHPKLAGLFEGRERQYPVQLATRFGRVFERIMSLWQTSALDDYFQSLFIDERGDRQGFPREVFSELFGLYQLHETCKARVARRPKDLWADERLLRRFHDARLDFSPKGFFRALEGADENALRLFIDAGVDLESTNTIGWTPLMVAAFMGSARKAAMLLDAGARVSCRDPRGYGPLHWAALRGYDAVVELLLRRGAHAGARSNKGITPLLQAAASGHSHVVRQLLKAQASMNQADDEGWTPLHKAVANGCVEVVRLLLAAGADAGAAHRSGATPLSIARSRNQGEILALLAPRPTRPVRGPRGAPPREIRAA